MGKLRLILTIFSLHAGEGISTHTASGDAMVQALTAKPSHQK